MTLIQIGLVDTTGKIKPELLQAAANALNVQVQRDLPQFWGVKATVVHLATAPGSRARIPSSIWPVQLVASLPPGEGGYHWDQHNQPYAKVVASPKDNSWTLDASHEVLEMLVDPYGNRLHSSAAIEIVNSKIQDAAGQFSYLVEACDPCEAKSYLINGLMVSDFITPHYYDPIVTPGTRYSFTGAITHPRQMLPGGYISFVVEATDEWKQILWVRPGSAPELVDLGPAGGAKSLRAWIDSGNTTKNGERRAIVKNATADCAKWSVFRRRNLDAIAERRAKRFGL